MAAHPDTHHRIPRPLQVLLVIVGALLISFGVPTLWLWIGSHYQGSSGLTRMTPEVAVVVFSGVIFTYLLLMIAGSVLAARSAAGSREPPAWNRSMRDQPRGREPLNTVELTFVGAAIIGNVSYVIWLIFLAEYTLPGG